MAMTMHVAQSITGDRGVGVGLRGPRPTSVFTVPRVSAPGAYYGRVGNVGAQGKTGPSGNAISITTSAC